MSLNSVKSKSGSRKAVLIGILLPVLMASSIGIADAKRVVENSCARQIQLQDDDDGGVKSLGAAPTAGVKEKIPCMVWVDKQPQVAMLCIHGFGLHKGTYDAFANEMAKQGVATYAIDCRGFGSWVARGKDKIDFQSTMTDIGLALHEIKRLNPNLKIIVLGESMGGAIAMKTAETYPDLVDGLISAVPAGDRFDKADSEIGIVKHVLLHGFNAPIDVGPAVVGSATKKESLKQTWLNDPLSRTKVTPNELIAFKNYMNDTFEVAPRIRKTKVLFIQGSNDKLVRPAGTWKLFNSLGTPHREIVMSKSAEHLIFEDGQFSNQDLGFVSSWISKNIAPISGQAIVKHKEKPLTTVAQSSSDADADKLKAMADTLANGTGSTTSDSTTTGGATQIASRPPSDQTNITKAPAVKTALSYWIELKRNGKVYRCNNKTSFKSGDAIRFHVMTEVDGYAYVVLEQGSTGNSAVLFPSKETGQQNYLRRDQDYPLPYQDWLAFDAHPGLEKVRIMFSQEPIALEPLLKKKLDQKMVAYVSADSSGAKDLIGTRMQLSWDDPNPVIMPDEVSSSAVAASPAANSQVRLVFDRADGTLAVDVALLHQ